MKIAYTLRICPMIFGALLYSIFLCIWAGSSLPYPDPTPQLLATQARTLQNTEHMMSLGLVLFLLGILYFFIIRFLYRRNSPV